MKNRKFVAFVKFLGWWCISFGVHIDIRAPHIAIHFPFGFATIGWDYFDPNDDREWKDGLWGIG